jgi:ATP-binding cassette subfamily F protein 3
VALTKLMLTDANFLILDEPTNHLDLDAQEALTQVLSAYDGTILFVSHDRAFIDDLATQIWSMEADQIETYVGNYSEYVEEKARQSELPHATDRAQQLPVATIPKPDSREASKSVQRQERAAQRDKERLQKRRNQAEARVGELEEKLNAVSDALTAATNARDLDAIVRLGTEYTKLETELDAAYAEWQRIEEEVPVP